MSDYGQAPEVSTPPVPGVNNFPVEQITEPPNDAILSNQQFQGAPEISPLASPLASPRSPRYPPASPYLSSAPYPGPSTQPPAFLYPPPSPYLDPTRFSYPQAYPTDLQMIPQSPNGGPDMEYRGEGTRYSPLAGQGVGYSHLQTVYHPPPQGPGTAYPSIQPAPPHQTNPSTNNRNNSLSGQQPGNYMTFMGQNPVFLTCPLCSENITSVVSVEPGTMTWIICCLLFLLTGVCCLIPFIVKGCMETIHKCPRCGLILNK